jgi:hypothetical protein
MKATAAITARNARENVRKSNVVSYSPAKGIEGLGSAGICVALGVILPYVLHPLGMTVRAILPMHFPIFLAGALVSPVYAILTGILAPAISSGLTGYPTTEQVFRMMPELAVYALTTTLMLKVVPIIKGLSEKLGRIVAIALAMLVAMIAGRLVYVAIYSMMFGTQSLNYFATVLLLPAWPGMLAQLIIIPLIAFKIHQATNR